MEGRPRLGDNAGPCFTFQYPFEALWDKLWTGGLSNPLDAIEQLSFLLFLKRLDEREQDNERAATRRKAKYEPLFRHFAPIPSGQGMGYGITY